MHPNLLQERCDKLKSELNEAKAKLSKLSRMIDIAGQANDAASEAEVANSATFAEAMAHTNLEMVEAERDQLKAELCEIKCELTLSTKTEDEKPIVTIRGMSQTIAKLRAEVERLKAADEAAGQAAFELQCQTMNERDQWRAVADCLFNVLTEDETNCEAYMNAYDSYKLALKGESAQ
jgi:uncharacterized small protein (DUF1192 family)